MSGWDTRSKYRAMLDDARRAIVVVALREHRGVARRAAIALGITPPAMYRLMRKLAITADAYRDRPRSRTGGN